MTKTEQLAFDIQKELDRKIDLRKKYPPYEFKPVMATVDRINLQQCVKLKHNEKKVIILNEKQQEAYDKYMLGHSFMLLGSAGSGKTLLGTYMAKARIEALPKTWDRDTSWYKDRMIVQEHRHVRKGLPGFVFITFTVRAGEAAAQALDIHVELNEYDSATDQWMQSAYTGGDLCHTAHAYLGYQPVEKWSTDDEGNEVKEMTFEATRNSENKMCPNIKTVFIDEAGMLSVLHGSELIHTMYLDGIQVIPMGDIAQLASIGEPSMLVTGLEHMEQVVLDETWRFGGMLLEWATAIRTKDLVIPARPRSVWKVVKSIKTDVAKARTWNETTDAGDEIELTRGAYHFFQKDVANQRGIYNFFFTEREDKAPAEALKRVSALLVNYIVKNQFNLGLDLLIIPQHVNTMGGVSTLRVVNSWLDRIYGRMNYLLNYGSGKAVIAVGDVCHLRRELHMIIGVQPVEDYKGLTPQDGCLIPTRDEDRWLDIHEAELRLGDDELTAEQIIKQMSDSSSVQAKIQQELLNAENDEAASEFDDDFDENKEHTEKSPRQLSHELLMLDLSGLVLHLSMTYPPRTAYEIAANFVRLVKELSINFDNSKQGQLIRPGHNQAWRDQLYILAQFYHLESWLVNALVTTKATRDFPSMGQKAGYQPGYFTCYQVQGAEARKIFVVGHRRGYKSNMVGNEFWYTSNTRSTNHTINVCSETLLDGSLRKGGVNHQAIEGITILQKRASYLKKMLTKEVTANMKHVIDTMGIWTRNNRFRKGGRWWLQGRNKID